MIIIENIYEWNRTAASAGFYSSPLDDVLLRFHESYNRILIISWVYSKMYL
jgi:hypothetical protein